MQIHQLGDAEDVLLNMLSIVWLQAQRRQIEKLILKLISCSSVWEQMWYLKYSKTSPWYEFLVIPLRFELLCSIMIPISVKV
jgi:hypothetical protein